MMPLDKNSTRFIAYCEINNADIDLHADAYGFDYSCNKILSGFSKVIKKPDDRLISKLLLDIDNMVNNY